HERSAVTTGHANHGLLIHPGQRITAAEWAGLQAVVPHKPRRVAPHPVALVHGREWRPRLDAGRLWNGRLRRLHAVSRAFTMARSLRFSVINRSHSASASANSFSLWRSWSRRSLTADGSTVPS